ncbi:hypothetical protein OA333_03265, partial [Candidatus Pelagibacter sp.]|nr:hypothetical protein [Candidatus Pelagibacter sp.]
IFFLFNGNFFLFFYNSGLENLLKFIFIGNEHGLLTHVKKADKNFFFLYFALYFILIGIYLLTYQKRLIFTKDFFLSSPIKVFDKLNKKEIYLNIVLAAGLSLFLELSIIRIHSSFLHFFSFLKNISLISCFLGLGIGYSLRNYKIFSINWIFPLLTIQIIILFLLSQTPISTILINPIAEQLAMGQDTARGFSHLIIIYTFLIFIYLFNALCFVPIGHLIAVTMIPISGLKAYGYNLIGSLIGIILFILLSFFWTPPSVWILISFLIFLVLNYKNKQKNLFSAFCVIIMAIFLSSSIKDNKQTIYSPYQNISIEYLTTPLNPIIMQTSHLFYQALLNLSEDLTFTQKERSPGNIFGYNIDVDHEREFYDIPYKIKTKKIKKILIVGSGAGNDVAAANRYNIENITAVEIDPVIADIGKKYHPEAPYTNNNVKLVIDDARSFIKNTEEKYDTIIYGLLDSQTNLSSKGGIRLDSYVFTLEAFEEAKISLSGNGFLYLSFFVQTPELGFKLFKMLEKTFGEKPIVLKSETNDRYIFISKKNNSEFFNFSKLKYFKKINNFDTKNYKVDLSTDDWPFIYMPQKVYPFTYLSIVCLLIFSSFIFINKINKIKRNNFSFICFFLGSGFMLVETKCITEIAKIYGSTWVVTSITIAVILLMAFVANYLIIKKVKINIIGIYSFLFLSLIIGYFFSKYGFNFLNQKIFSILLPFVLTLPLLFSGLAFSKEISRLNSASQALSANILGAMLGGFLEYNSMYFGLTFLYYLAGFLYFLAFISYYFKYKTIY